MHDDQSFNVRSIDEVRVMSEVASLAQVMVREAAQPVPSGETVKGQLRRAARALGYRDGDWRVRSAWYGEAGAWSAAAFVDLQKRFNAWRVRHERRARAEVDANVERYRSVVAGLRAIDPDFHRDTIAALERAIDAARPADRPVDR